MFDRIKKKLKKYRHLMRFRLAFGIGVVFILTVLLSGCGISKEPIVKTGFYFDTIIRITLYDRAQESCLEECFALAAKYEKMLSPTVEGSDLWNINHSGGKPVEVSDETAMLLATALSYCDIARGRIDITIETVSNLWNFHPDIADLKNSMNTETTSRIPSVEALSEVVSHVDYHNLQIEGNTVTLLDPEASVSLGFIAKGFIADKMKEYLLSQNVKSGIIDLGGNLLAVGSRPDGTPFQFGIQKPFDTQGTPITVLSVSDRSAVSSGVYERYFYEEGTLYHHILDPVSGYPVKNQLLGVTIFSDSSMTGDALSTTCFVLGLEEGMELVESLEDVEAVFITDDYVLHYSNGLKSAE